MPVLITFRFSIWVVYLTCPVAHKTKVHFCLLALEQKAIYQDGLETWSPTYSSMCLHKETLRSYCTLQNFSENPYGDLFLFICIHLL